MERPHRRRIVRRRTDNLWLRIEDVPVALAARSSIARQVVEGVLRAAA